MTPVPDVTDRASDMVAMVRVTRSGPALPFRFPVVPPLLAVTVMALVVAAAVVVAVVAVLS